MSEEEFLKEFLEETKQDEEWIVYKEFSKQRKYGTFCSSSFCNHYNCN